MVILQKTLGWLRAGYPDGMPQQDYVALLAVLRHNLTETEIRRIVTELTRERAHQDAVADCDIQAAIAAHALETASEVDVARIRARLVAGGWS